MCTPFFYGKTSRRVSHHTRDFYLDEQCGITAALRANEQRLQGASGFIAHNAKRVTDVSIRRSEFKFIGIRSLEHE